jgi:hypothetical protein
VLPWELWDTAVSEALPLFATEKTSTRQEIRAWTHVFESWKARVCTPGSDSPMRLLREDRPPLGAAAAWWSVLVEGSGVTWEPAVNTLIRECRSEYIETLNWTKSIDEAVRRTELRWDRQCNAFFPGTFPATPAETLRRIERRLEEITALRAHAAHLLRTVLPAEEAHIARRAAQLYALDELEFERELKWVSQLRAAVEGDAPLPKGTAYSYVDPVQPADPEPTVDPFAFGTSSPVPEKPASHLRIVPAVAAPAVDPFDFDQALTDTKS